MFIFQVEHKKVGVLMKTISMLGYDFGAEAMC